MEVAEIFNEFFVQKIEKLKENIDQSYVEDPLVGLKNKVESKNLKFNLATISEEKILKAIKGMKTRRAQAKMRFHKNI